MAYINYKLLFEKGFTLEDYHVLNMLNQKEYVFLEAFSDTLDKFIELGIAGYKKGKEGSLNFLRIDARGVKLLEELHTYNFSIDIEEVQKNIEGLYEVNGNFIGKRLKIRENLIWFKQVTIFNNKIIVDTVSEYLHSQNPDYIMSLENLIWRPQSKAFSVHKTLKDSLLYELVCKKYKIDTAFFENKKSTKEVNWLDTVSRLVPSKAINSELYFTGSMRTDLEHIEKVKVEYFKRMKK